MTYTVLIREGNESGYVVTVPSLPGCVSQGRTRRDAIRNIKVSVAAYIEALIEDGIPVPREEANEFVQVEVTAR
jgi:predicted RNase H-like HicB family nuclease